MAAPIRPSHLGIFSQLCDQLVDALNGLHETYLRQMPLFTTAPKEPAAETYRVAMRVFDIAAALRPLDYPFATSLDKAAAALAALSDDIRARKAGAVAAIGRLGRIVREYTGWHAPWNLPPTALAALRKLETRIAGEPD